MKKRVLLAGLFHETNTFLQGLTSLQDFDTLRGEEIFSSEGDSSPMGGALKVAREENWEVVPAIDMRAMPSGLVSDAVAAHFFNAIRSCAASEAHRGFDGIFLVLHGAMTSESLQDVEGELLARIREIPGLEKVPLCGVTDLHANATDLMARCSSALVTYRENPHTDGFETSVRAARILERLMTSGEEPVTLWEQPPIVWPPTGTATASDPVRSLEERARQMEAANPDLLAVNVYAGFSFADMREAGPSFSAVTVGSPLEARAAVSELSQMAVAMKAAGNVVDMPLEDAMERLSRHREGPVLIVEPADNIGGGSPGDCTRVLRAFVERRLSSAGAVINDPELVRALAASPTGSQGVYSIGGKSGAIGAEPLELDVELISRSDGRFTLEDPQSHLSSMYGQQIDMGPCAVVRHGGILILLTSRKTPPFDLGQWRSQGIQPEKLFAINIKAAVAHRRAYDPIARASYSVDTPGPCSSGLRHLPFRNIRRPVYPLDAQA